VNDDLIHRHYEPRVDPDRPGFEIADWADAYSQQARFQVLIDQLDLKGRSLLDVGCGAGDLWTFLNSRKITVDYLGVDVVEKVIAEAQRRHPNGQFQSADLFGRGPSLDGPFDIVYASGVFNLDSGRNRESLPGEIERLLTLTGITLMFNLLHARESRRYGDCFYWDPDEVRHILKSFDCQWRIIDDYLPNDFTVIGRKKSTPLQP